MSANRLEMALPLTRVRIESGGTRFRSRGGSRDLSMSIRNIFCILAASGLTTGTLWAQGFSPEEAVQRMQVPPGFQVKLAACEPEVRQPVTMTFDDRGRLWVIQYLQ